MLACGRRWGKTQVCAEQVRKWLTDCPAAQILILAPTADQATLLFDRALDLLFKNASPSERGWTLKRSPYPILKNDQASLMARSGHNGHTLRGNEATHIIIDEAAYLPESVITEIAMPMLATTEGSLTLISTPNGMNHFWRFFQLGARGEHGVWSYTGPSWQSPHVSQNYLSLQKELISDRAYRVEYGAEFLDGEGRIFRTESIENCVVSELPEHKPSHFCIGIDLGKYRDFTAVCVLAGTKDACTLVHAERFHGVGWIAQVEKVAAIVRRFQPATISLDATGLGDPVCDMLTRELPEAAIRPVVLTRPGKQAMIDKLAWIIERSALKMLPYPDLVKELQHFEISADARGERLSATAGFHDDLVIALALAASSLHSAYRAPVGLGPNRTFARDSVRIVNR